MGYTFFQLRRRKPLVQADKAINGELGGSFDAERTKPLKSGAAFARSHADAAHLDGEKRDDVSDVTRPRHWAVSLRLPGIPGIER
jgi:hypothetical protein